MSKNAKKRHPWAKWYFRDFSDDVRLKMCSRAARSVWHDMLGIMHEATPRGFLMIEGISLTTEQLANLLGERVIDLRKWLGELKAAGVPSFVGEDMPPDVFELVPHGMKEGTILSRRMVRDTAKEELDRTNGKGGGNPLLGAQPVIPGVNPPDNHPHNPKYRKRGEPVKAQMLDARSHRIPPCPPSDPVNRPPPPQPDPSWEPWRERALSLFGKGCCEAWLFPCPINQLEKEGMGLEAPNTWHSSQIERQCGSQKLWELFGMAVKVTVPKGRAA